MALTVTHPFVSLEPAKTDPAEVGGADWNADHTLSGTLPVANGGTGSSTASDARTALGLGTIATQNSNSVSITGGSISGATVTVSDAALTIQDNSDATKQLVFQLSGITAGQTRTLTVPDASTTLVGQDTADSLTNKVTVDTTNLEVSNIKAKDGTAAGTITDTTGVVTLNSAVLTTADINGGTIDGTVIGGTSAAAITGTTITASTQFSGPHNGTVGATTPAAGTFTALTATGNTALGDAEATDTHTIKGATTLSVNSASPALTINQIGTGNAITIEDSASPDATPWIVDATGVMVSGKTSSITTTTAGTARIQSANLLSAYLAEYNGADASGPVFTFAKNRAGSIINLDDNIGQFRFEAWDGSAYFRAVQITASCDATPGTNDTAGRVTVSTTPDGSTTPTEALRIDSTQAVLAKSATGGLGYGSGAGGTVTQTTSRTTGVTINKVCGAITLVSAAGTTTWQSFTVTNSTVAATDVIHVCQKSGTDLNEIHVTAVAAGSFRISFRTTAGTTTEQPVFNFAVIKAVTS